MEEEIWKRKYGKRTYWKGIYREKTYGGGIYRGGIKER